MRSERYIMPVQHGYYPKIIYKICITCGDDFTTKSHKSILCAKCQNIRKQNIQREKYQKVQYLENICDICGNKYKTKRPNQKFCKPECSKIGYDRAYIKKRKEQGKSSSWQIFNRDNFTCQYCGKNPTEDNVKLNVDHIKPRTSGGTDDFENLITACEQCNCEKGTMRLYNEVAFKKRLIDYIRRQHEQDAPASV